ncbi:hypothetical protein SDC9_176197 [bioreactor metagenome]|uniref:Uncharacterized protein n=1 Tax=bioreactor metagenome TaxID=1076179 RepID=A0A645GS36_9ZZZZ
MLDARHMGLRAQLEVARGVRRRKLGVQRGPFRAALAALEAEAQLHAASTVVARLAVDGHVAGVHFLVAQLGGTGIHHLEVVIARQTGNAVGARHAHFVFCTRVIGCEILVGDGPIQQVRALDLAVHGARAELVFLKAQRCARPVRGGASHGLADPCGQLRKILGDAPTA